MPNFLYFKKIKTIQKYLLDHKIISGLGILIVIGVGYGLFAMFGNNGGQPKYVLAQVTKDTVVASVTGTGQVSTSNQIELKSKTSGDVLYLGVTSGQEVSAGTLIARLDTRDAEIALESSKIALEKLTKPAEPADVHTAQNAVTEAYSSGWNEVSDTFSDLPTIVNGLKSLLEDRGAYLNDQSIPNESSAIRDARDKVSNSYSKAQTEYDKVLQEYNNSSRLSSADNLQSLIESTYQVTKDLSDAVKDSQSTITLLSTYYAPDYNPNGKAQAISNTTDWSNSLNTHLASLLGAKNTIIQKNDALTTLQQGTDPLDIQAQQLAVQQKQYAYEDSFVRAPFDGIIAKVNVKLNDSISSGTSVGTLITKQKIAEISLNEVDITKIKVGQKVNLTFDAVDGLTITGQVLEVDLVGTVNQGVVTYDVKIGFDTDDSRIKSGMSVNANIITDVKQDVLTVPNSAIKSQGDTYYVEMFDQPFVLGSTASDGVTSLVAPRQQPVEIGLANDTVTEITSGLKENDQIITRTILPSSTKTTSTAPSLFGASGRTGNGGSLGGVRATTR